MTTLPQTLEEIKAQFAATLNGRCERAAKIALSGAVSRVDDYTWSVASQSDPGKSYTVTFKLSWQCDCRDYIGDGYAPAPTAEFFGGTGATCKHILAVGACWVSGEYPSPKQAPLFDLAIATRKRPFTTGSEDYLIVWYKKAGEVAVHSKGKKLTDSDIQKALGKYALADTEARQSMVVRRYNLILNGEQ